MTYAIRNAKTGKWWSFVSGIFHEAAIGPSTMLRASRHIVDDEALMIAQSWSGDPIEVCQVDDAYIADNSTGICQCKTIITWNN